MKTLSYIILLIFSTLIANAQDQYSDTSNVEEETTENFHGLDDAPPTNLYGLNVYSSSTGSGKGSTTNFNTIIENNHRSLEFGAAMMNSSYKIMGADVLYKVYLNHRNETLSSLKGEKTILRIYVHYNFMYNKLEKEPLTVPVSSKKSGETSSSMTIPLDNRITTMEHYVGMGAQLHFAKNMNIDSNFGVGTYLGSVFNPGHYPSSIGIHRDNGGYTMSFNIGVGYTF
jgi:hypothetical protein